MSDFTNYESNPSSDYDIYRIPSAVEVFTGIMRKHSPTKFEKATMLDLGAGSGSYAKAILDEGLGNATLAEASATMLNQAKDKLAKAGYAKKSSCHQVILPDLSSFSSNKYDIVMTSLVLHHLPKCTSDPKTGDVTVTDWSPVSETVNEAARVLKDNGVFVCGYATPEQLSAQWFASLVPINNSRTKVRGPSESQMIEYCEKAGLEIVGEYSINDGAHYIGYKNYNDEELFLKDANAWMCDSVLSSASEEELNSAKKLVRDLKASGELRAFHEKHNMVRKHGCARILAAVKRV